MHGIPIEWFSADRGQVGTDVRRVLRRRLRVASRRIGIPRGGAGSVSIHLVDDSEMTRIAREQLGKRGPTDVLSFPTTGQGFGVPNLGLGDIVLNVDAVSRQARRDQGRQTVAAVGSDAWLDEATVLLIHGLVHLLGYDHRTRREGRAMHRTELRGLRAAKVADIPRPYGCRPASA